MSLKILLQQKLGSCIYKLFTNGHFHFIIVELVTSHVLLQGLKQMAAQQGKATDAFVPSWNEYTKVTGLLNILILATVCPPICMIDPWVTEGTDEPRRVPILPKCKGLLYFYK
jgi:hypothetical protein